MATPGPLHPRERSRGLLLGLALGDALGRPVEFLSLDEIRKRHGSLGVREPEGPLVPTEDTSLSLAVAEALVGAGAEGPEALMDAIVREFLRWRREVRDEDRPGATCLEATARLAAGTRWTEAGLSWSKGSGAVMRAAPVGFFFASYPLLLREVSRAIARVTHGHPTAQAAAVAVAVAAKEAADGAPPGAWVEKSRRALAGMSAWEMAAALEEIEPAVRETDDAAAMERLGEGWVSEEAAAMAMAAVLRHPDDFREAVRCAVNHGGDSDTVGCIAGALSGGRLGEGALPGAWLEALERADEIRDLADRLASARDGLR
jgi:ADP-ribosylglycohydrolase